MAYRVDLTTRATADLRRIYRRINAANSLAARDWFEGLEVAILGLAESPSRNPRTPENAALRHLLYRSKSYVYRVIYALDEDAQRVTVLHIRHGAQEPMPTS